MSDYAMQEQAQHDRYEDAAPLRYIGGVLHNHPASQRLDCGEVIVGECIADRGEQPSDAAAPLRNAAQELSDALDAPGPRDPAVGLALTIPEVEKAWAIKDLRVDMARDALRAALAATLTPEEADRE